MILERLQDQVTQLWMDGLDVLLPSSGGVLPQLAEKVGYHGAFCKEVIPGLQAVGPMLVTDPLGDGRAEGLIAFTDGRVYFHNHLQTSLPRSRFLGKKGKPKCRSDRSAATWYYRTEPGSWWGIIGLRPLETYRRMPTG